MAAFLLKLGGGIAEVYIGNPGPVFEAEAATPALALCAAALLARASKEQPGND